MSASWTEDRQPSAFRSATDGLDALFERLGVVPRIVCETDERAAWPALAAAGIGHVLVSRRQAERAERISPGRTRIVGFEPPLRQTIALIRRPGG